MGKVQLKGSMNVNDDLREPKRNDIETRRYAYSNRDRVKKLGDYLARTESGKRTFKEKSIPTFSQSQKTGGS